MKAVNYDGQSTPWNREEVYRRVGGEPLWPEELSYHKSVNQGSLSFYLYLPHSREFRIGNFGVTIKMFSFRIGSKGVSSLSKVQNYSSPRFSVTISRTLYPPYEHWYKRLSDSVPCLFTLRLLQFLQRYSPSHSTTVSRYTGPLVNSILIVGFLSHTSSTVPLKGTTEICRDPWRVKLTRLPVLIRKKKRSQKGNSLCFWI